MEDPSWLTASSKPKKPALTSGAITTPSFKVILVGDVGVGKTTLFSRFRQPDKVPGEAQSAPSIGADTCTRTVCTRRGDVTMNVWDTAGTEKYRTLTRNYHRNSQAALLVFSVEDPLSLSTLSSWQREVLQSSPSGQGVEAALTAIGDHLATETQQHDKMYNTDCLWLQGSGAQVNGRFGKENSSKCCS